MPSNRLSADSNGSFSAPSVTVMTSMPPSPYTKSSEISSEASETIISKEFIFDERAAFSSNPNTVLRLIPYPAGAALILTCTPPAFEAFTNAYNKLSAPVPLRTLPVPSFPETLTISVSVVVSVSPPKGENELDGCSDV